MEFTGGDLGNQTGGPGRLFRVDGKVALVTGGYGGIGAAVSEGLAAMGAKVAIAGRNRQKAEEAAAALQEQGSEAYGASFDAASVAETRAMVDAVAGHFGALDILVNCVGLNREQKAEDYDEATFDHVVDVNLKGAMFQAQAAARHMIRQGTGGKQVHIGSVRSRVALRGRGYSAYCATKGGLSMLCQQLAAEWAPHKIHVNVVAPTFVRTGMIAYMLSDEAFVNQILARIPLGRIAEPEEVMSAVLFFASAASDFVTGQTLYMDGGVTATQ
ncbi:MAG TPA: SDR family oxidoreductase [Bryobacteraceae bacterium]|nr:SDR family oxidoreductase [Bryobacteraceae bacterium]